jgi:endonuclease-3
LSTPQRRPARRRVAGPRATRRPGRESAAARAERAETILARLKAEHPDAHCALDHADAYQLLVATILSAQCTDARVNQVTPGFFARYPEPEDLARADQTEVEELIRSTGFFRNKARSLIGMARALVADHAGVVPRTMEELQDLPGVGRKTANVVLGNAYGINEGVTVDTHVTRLSRLLGLTRHDDPVRIEQDLMLLVPREEWALVSHLLIFHGRQVCVARRPRCPDCVVADLCPSAAI